MTNSLSPTAEREALLPCPFCGSPAAISYARDGDVCNARCVRWGKGCMGAGANCYHEIEARQAWNRRAALLEPVGDGWVMVPKEPTEEMLDAACDVDARAQVERKNLVRFPGLMPHASAGDVWPIQYQAAIAASPKTNGGMGL